MISGYSGYSGYGVLIEVAIADKPLPKVGYYAQKEEDAVIRFIAATTEGDKRRIYNNELKKPIDKMIESIIRTYRLYRKDFNFIDLHADALSFLITKFDKFDPTMGKKSFSYFGTICRNYLYGEMIKAYKKSTRTLDYDDVINDLMQRPDMIVHIDKDELDMQHFIDKLILEIETELKDEKIGDNEYKIGVSLVQILKDWNTLFEDFVGTPKFNKNLILLWLREMTGLTTKEIRNAMRRFKSLYYIFKDNYIT
jgi:hypothetical protein